MVTTRGIKPVSSDELPILRELAIQTFRETFGHDNSEAQLQEFFDKDYSLEQLQKELADPETEVDFLMLNGQPVGFIKLNWGQAQTEQELEDGFEIQRIYVLNAYQGQGLGKFLFDYAMEVAANSGKTWAWLGVWEHNVKAQRFYEKYGFEKFGEHHFEVGDKVDTDWLMKKALK
ncbi:GNAT family N-acetyltransferase [Streptococcus rifensis]